jgi:RimJ/RimL family protein N-acetyltransferase
VETYLHLSWAPIVLDSARVRLEPIDRRHAPDLAEAGADPEVWRWLSQAPPDGCALPERTAWFERWIDWSLERVAEGDIVFATIRKGVGGAPDRAVGSTRYMGVRPEHRGLEIGWTWLGVSAQRTHVNTQAKLLMLTHAFETLGMIRVELKTDSRNAQSRAAIERIGASFEGILRNHMIRRDGSYRDSALYSITEDQWPAIKVELDARSSAV